MMPWTAVPFEADRQSIKQLHGVQGIPMLPIFTSDGKKIADNGRQDVHQGQAQGTHAAVLEAWGKL